MRVKDLMIYRILFCLMTSLSLLSHEKGSLVRHLQHRYIRTITLTSEIEALSATKAFVAIAQYDHKKTFGTLLENLDIQAFLASEVGDQGDQMCFDNIHAAQKLMLLELYGCLYQQYIRSAKSFLNDILVAKKYWYYEQFYLKQRSLTSHPLYLLYSNNYQHRVNTTLQEIEKLEEQIAHMLGICLYGSHLIASLNTESEVSEILCEAILPLYQIYNVPMSGCDSTQNISISFNELGYLYHHMNEHMTSVRDVLHDLQKPQFVIQHWAGCSCAAITVVLAGALYYKYQKDLPALTNKTIKVIDDFIDEYVVQSIEGLVKVVWHGNKGTIPRIPQVKPLSHFHNLATKLSGTEKDLNVKIDEINEREQAWTKSSNQLLDVVEETFVKNQQVNMYLAAIGPVLLGVYLGHKGINKAYHRYVEHDTWHVPMRYYLRSIMQQINLVAQKPMQRSFAVDGKVYMLVTHLRQYISCLKDEELMMMHQDLHDLLSFDLNYDQKQHVIERMYRSYQFLK